MLCFLRGAVVGGLVQRESKRKSPLFWAISVALRAFWGESTSPIESLFSGFGLAQSARWQEPHNRQCPSAVMFPSGGENVVFGPPLPSPFPTSQETAPPDSSEENILLPLSRWNALGFAPPKTFLLTLKPKRGPFSADSRVILGELVVFQGSLAWFPSKGKGSEPKVIHRKATRLELPFQTIRTCTFQRPPRRSPGCLVS